MPSILIMDDDADHRRVIQHMLHKLYPGFEITEYSQPLSDNPDHIPDIQKYDLVLMDTTVGGQSSMAWMKAVMGNYPDAPAFIILSSVPEPTPIIMQQLVIAIRQGVINFYFKKKLDMQPLLADISNVINKAAEQGSEDSPTDQKDTKEDTTELQETLKEKREREAMEQAALALDSLQGFKQWPFTMDAILSGNATLGPYKIDAYLGEDNTASTFKAVVQKTNTPIALKIINRLRVGGKPIPESFIERFKTITENKHPNVIRPLKYGIVKDRMCVALEFLHGGTLEDKLKASRLDEKIAIHYFRQLLEGMASLHELGIELHQIVPRQIMFRDEKTLVLTQIGLLNGLHALSELAGEWPLPFSTPIYTSPESTQKQPTDYRTDIYLAGLIGYEMLSGHPMYASGSDQDIMYAHIMEPMPLLPDNHPVNALLASIVEKQPDKRPQSAKIIIEKLNRIYPV